MLKAEFGEGGAFSNLQLGAHQVDAGHFLGDGVLHLQPGVGLDEGEASRRMARRTACRTAIGHQKLHGAGAAVTGRLAEAQGRVGERLLQFVIE